MKFITTPNRLIKSEIALWWQADALHAGGKYENNINSVISQLLTLDCACSCNYTLLKCIAFIQCRTVMLPDGIPLGTAGTALHLHVIKDLHLQLPVRLRSILLPHYLSVFRNSCLPPAVNYATVVFTMNAETQTRTYNLSGVEDGGWMRVCPCCRTVTTTGIYSRQLRVTCSSTDAPRRRMTMRLEVKSCRRNLRDTDSLLWQPWGLVTHKHKTAQELRKSVLFPCVANPAAVTEQHEFLYYITHLPSKSSESTQHCCPLACINEQGIKQFIKYCGQSLGPIVSAPGFTLCIFILLCSLQHTKRQSWHNECAVLIWQDLM